MTVPLCKFKTLFTLLKYYGNNLGFLKLTKKNVVWFSSESGFVCSEAPLWLTGSGLESRVTRSKHQSVRRVVLP